MHAFFLLVFLWIAPGVLAQPATDTVASSSLPALHFNGQLAAWSGVQAAAVPVWMAGGRFVPTLTGSSKPDGRAVWDMETSLNINGSLGWSRDSLASYTGRIKPYRIWIRYSTSRFELRAGLQKMNFGAAKMLRPLMWFDGMDIRDPLQLTDGVYGLLSRYYFAGNATLWAWALAGNHRPKGYEWVGTARLKPELGGRVQLPAGPGEVGISYHYREADPRNSLIAGAAQYTRSSLAENRMGFDGKWDVGVGLWVEGSLTALEKDRQLLLPTRTDMLNLGMDYTFPLGNGLGLTLEYFRYHAGDRFFTGGAGANVLASMASYPLSLIDNVSVMTFCIPSPGRTLWMNYLSWSRTYDQLSVYLIGFISPEDIALPVMALQRGSNGFAGKGIQLMLSYNF